MKSFFMKGARNMIKEYEVNIAEILNRTVKVKASNPDEAVAKVEEMYYAGDIVLDADDFVSVDFFEDLSEVDKDEDNLELDDEDLER